MCGENSVYETSSDEAERVLILGVDTGVYDADASADELRELIKTAGGETAGVIIQQKEKEDSVTYVGSGKLHAAKEFCDNADIDLVVCDTELTPTQQRVLEKLLERRVIDRTVLILDIFAARAKSNEGKLQVELAQLKYSLPRLTGRGAEMSRLGGGIGTRGPGESKLESDKRHIRRRIHSLEEQLEALTKRRELRRERRKKDGVVTAAIVGYTNAGKSTLLNKLTDAGVLAENKLFATLDPTSRAIKLPDGREIMLIDTVGFISRLPHGLVEAFKSTLEEATCADLLIVLCDASDPMCEQQLEITTETLKELGADTKPTVTVYNKCDIASNFLQPVSRSSVRISALNGTGIDNLLQCIADNLPDTTVRLLLKLPFSRADVPARLRSIGTVFAEDYKDDGIYVDTLIDKRYMKEYVEYIIKT